MKCQHMTCHQCVDAEVTILQKEITRLRRALAAGPAHIRAQVNVEPTMREAYAAVCEAAQRRAMEEE